MTGLTKPKLIAYLTAIFLAGVVTGGLIGYSMRPHHRFSGPPSEEQILEFVKRKLADEVGVTDEQWHDGIGAILTNSVREIAQLDRENRSRIQELIDRTDAAVIEKLPPEQKPRMEALIQERKKQYRAKHGRGE